MALTKVDQTMVSDQVFGRRRLNINGGMDIAQRGTVNNVTSAYGGPDRYKLASSNSFGEFQLSQSASSPDGFRNSMHVNCTTADASPSADEYIVLVYAFEGFDCQPLKFGTSSAEQVTISFYVKTNKTGTYNVELYAADNSSNPSASKQYTVSSADTWEQKIVTLPCGNSAEIPDDNTAGLLLQFWLGAGSSFTGGSAADGNFQGTTGNRAVGQVNLADSTSNSFRITGIQVETGDNATPFEYRSFGEELAMCQRYYQKSRDNSPPTQNSFGGVQINVPSGTDPQVVIPLHPNMRTTPSVTLYSSYGSGTSGQWYGLAFGTSFSSNARAFGASSRGFIIDNTDVGSSQAGWCEIGYVAESEI